MKSWRETSIVDTPSNPTAFFSVVAKSAGGAGETDLVDIITTEEKTSLTSRISELADRWENHIHSGEKTPNE